MKTYTKPNSVIKRIWWLAKPFKVQSAFALLIMLVSALFEMFNLAVLYPIINYGLKQNSDNIILIFFNEILSIIPIKDLFLSSCILLIIITILSAILKYTNSFVSNKLMAKIIEYYQQAIFSKYVDSDYPFFVENKQGELIHTGTTATDMTSSMVVTIIRLCNDLIYMFTLFGLLLTLSFLGSQVIVVIGLLYYLVVKKISKKIVIYYGTLQVEADREKATILNEFISGIASIKVLSVSKYWQKKYNKAVNKKVKSQYRMLMGRMFPELLSKFFSYLVIAIIGIYLSFKAELEMLNYIPLLATFTLTMNRLIPATNGIGNQVMTLASCLPSVNIVYEMIHQPTKIIPEGSKVLKNFSGAISFENVWFKYDGSPEYLLRDINFSIDKNKVTAIVGSSGNGKTTLLNLLIRLQNWNKGEITLDSTNISEFTLSSYLSKIGYVGQEPFMFNNTIKENIRFGMQNCSNKMIIESAKLANAHEFIMNTEDGFDTVVGDAGVKLSGGQRQRIAIARAILKKPEILVFDEATSSLDNISEKKVQSTINKVSKHTTIVIVAHRLSTIQNADKILVLYDGGIIEEGKHNDLIAKKGKYYHLYNVQ